MFAWPWLAELSQRHGRAVTLADVPAREWDALLVPGLEAVWLMGAWERSPLGRAEALADEGVRRAVLEALPDAREEDVVGSAYCVRDYAVDARLGGDDGLAAARAELRARGLRLLLDFVPNHVAPDHPWALAHPEWFVREPDGSLANARDPYFPPWTDVVQVDAMSPGLREAAVEALVRIGERCDGVRCDMAILLLDDVARRTWGDRLSPPRPEPYWVEVIRRVRETHPELVFLAEAYWDLEARLLEEGFDLCYDKRLYDRLRDGDAAALRAHLQADPAFQRRLVRFLENHDEPRAAAVFPPDRLRAAAATLATLPGTILLYEGQLEGRRVRPPVQVARRPAEPGDPLLAAFWHELLATPVREGEWRLLEVDGDDALLAWRWARHAVVVNWSPGPAEGTVRELDLYVRLDSYGFRLVPLDSANASPRP